MENMQYNYLSSNDKFPIKLSNISCVLFRAAVLAGLAIAAACGCWLWKRRRMGSVENGTPSDRASAGSCYPPPHYSRCNSFIQALPPPYNEVSNIYVIYFCNSVLDLDRLYHQSFAGYCETRFIPVGDRL